MSMCARFCDGIRSLNSICRRSGNPASVCYLFQRQQKKLLQNLQPDKETIPTHRFWRTIHNPMLSFGYSLQVLVVWVRLPQKYECLPGDLKHCNWIWAEEAACIHVTFSGNVSWGQVEFLIRTGPNQWKTITESSLLNLYLLIHKYQLDL